MNKYLFEIEKYFGIKELFEISATNKNEARIKCLNNLIDPNNYRIDTLKCIKKINKNK